MKIVTTGVLAVALFTPMVTAMSATSKGWGAWCVNEGRWIFVGDRESDANAERSAHIRSYSPPHIVYVYPCDDSTDNCTKNMNK